MKILMVSSFLPYPLYSGGHIRLYNILRNLSKSHEITLVCEKRDYQTEKDVKKIEAICKSVFTVDRNKQWALSNILKTGFSQNSFLITGHINKDMKNVLKSLLKKEKYDLIHIETFYVAQNLPAGRQGIPETAIPVVVAEHNIEYMVYQKFVRKTNPLLKPLLYIDISKIRENEENVWRKANAVITVSEKDKKIVEEFNQNVYVVPNGVDLNKFKVKSEKLKVKINKKTILFIGDFKWVQNRDATLFILEKVWPQLKWKMENGKWKIKLWIVGKNIPKSLKTYNSAEVIFDETAPDDTAEIFKKADILLAPIRVGGGTSYKILEAMASGVPVVTTTLGAIGLRARDKEEILIADREEEIVNGIKSLLKDRILFEKIVKNARRLVEENYDWDAIVENLEGIYKKLISNN